MFANNSNRSHACLFNKPIPQTKTIIFDITNIERVMELDKRFALFKHTNIVFDGKTIPLNTIDHENFLQVDNNATYEILFKHSHAKNSPITKLSSEMNQNLLKFLSSDRKQNECCIDFVNDLVFGCGQEALDTLNTQGEHIPLLNDDVLKIGEVVALGRFMKKIICGKEESVINPNHLAIYIGEKLYISVMGLNMPIYITTLDQMKKLYDDKEAAHIKLTPLAVRDPTLAVHSYRSS